MITYLVIILILSIALAWSSYDSLGGEAIAFAATLFFICASMPIVFMLALDAAKQETDKATFRLIAQENHSQRNACVWHFPEN